MDEMGGFVSCIYILGVAWEREIFIIFVLKGAGEGSFTLLWLCGERGIAD